MPLALPSEVFLGKRAGRSVPRAQAQMAVSLLMDCCEVLLCGTCAGAHQDFMLFLALRLSRRACWVKRPRRREPCLLLISLFLCNYTAEGGQVCCSIVGAHLCFSTATSPPQPLTPHPHTQNPICA